MIAPAAVASVQGVKLRPCEDRYRLLDARVPLVKNANRGFLYAVIDGMGSAPKALRAAQHIADRLIEFYRSPAIPDTVAGLYDLLIAINHEIRDWGVLTGNRPVGAAAATLAWLSPSQKLILLQCGDGAPTDLRLAFAPPCKR